MHCEWEIQQQYLIEHARFVYTSFKNANLLCKGKTCLFEYPGIYKKSMREAGKTLRRENRVIGLLYISEVKMTWRSLHHLKIALFPGWKEVLWRLNQLLYGLYTQNHLHLLYVEDFSIPQQCWERAGLVSWNLKNMDYFCERKALDLLQWDREKKKNEPLQYSVLCCI